MVRRILLALGFVLAGLFGRTLLDNLLIARGGLLAVAEWAQLSSLAEIVSGVSLAGIGAALPALIAGDRRGNPFFWLKPALLISAGLSLLTAGAGAVLLYCIDRSPVPGEPWLIPTALIAGLLAVGPGVLCVHFLGMRQPGRAAALVLAGFLLPLAMLLLRPFATVAANPLVGQLLFGAMVVVVLAVALRRQPAMAPEAVLPLLRFIPASIAIGIFGPAATAWARIEVAAGLSWHAVGQMQALWRISDWVTAIMFGVLNAYFLPRLGAIVRRDDFVARMRQTARLIMLLAAVALTLVWCALPWLLELLYRSDLGIRRADALLFFVGDLLRVASWVWLIGLFARRAAWAIAVGEFLSLPLFAVLLAVVGPRTLTGVGGLWLTTYVAYGLFNWWALRRRIASLPEPRTN